MVLSKMNQGEGEPPHTPAQPSWTRVSIVALALLAAVAAVLRFHFLAQKPFWFDECFSVEAVRLSWHDFVRLLWWREANMSLYYVLLRGWLHLGSNLGPNLGLNSELSPFFVRSLSVLCSLATLPAIFWLGCKLFDRRVGLIAAALMTCNAYSVRYAQEARSYSLFVLLVTLSSGFFVACVREPSPSERTRRSYVLASVLGVYAHLYALLLIAAQWLSWRGIQGRHESAAHAATTFAPRWTAMRRTWISIAIATLPLMAFVLKTGAGSIRWIQRPGVHDLLDYGERLAGNNGMPLLLLYTAACLAAIIPLRRRLFTLGAGREAWRVQFLLIWLLFPAALTLTLSLARPVFLARYLIFCLPALILLAAAGLANLRKAWMMCICLATLLLLSLQGTSSYYDHDFDLERDGSEAATNYVYDHAQPGDAILFHVAQARIPYEYFSSVRAAKLKSSRTPGPEIMFPRHGDHLDYRDVTGNPTSEFLRSVPGQYARVWVVLMSNGSPGHTDATTQMIDQILTGSYPRSERMQFSQVEVRLQSRP